MTMEKSLLVTNHSLKNLIVMCTLPHPYSSWERGLNEYTNKLLRQYFPKNKTLKNISQNYILDVVEKLNNRPRKKLGFKTPKQVYYKYIWENQKTCT